MYRPSNSNGKSNTFTKCLVPGSNPGLNIIKITYKEAGVTQQHPASYSIILLFRKRRIAYLYRDKGKRFQIKGTNYSFNMI